ncbi:hypothetical protein RJ55_04118 [Drechmeria coniospora]|nr:hypothetical protein RJ55_04118 [Drechmeria coniospora]
MCEVKKVMQFTVPSPSPPFLYLSMTSPLLPNGFATEPATSATEPSSCIAASPNHERTVGRIESNRQRHRTGTGTRTGIGSKPDEPSRQDSKHNRSVDACNATVFHPRPFEEIYTEQAYLTASLQVQTRRAGELIRRYCSADEELTTVQESKRRRSLRKHLNLLRLQINAAAEQEKVIFMRLSELYLEAQSRQTWGWARQQRQSTKAESGTIVASDNPSSPDTQSSSCATTRSWSPLNGATPEFVPGNRLAQLADATSVAKSLPERKLAADQAPSGPKNTRRTPFPAPETTHEGGGDFGCNHGLSFLYEKYGEHQREEESQRGHTPHEHEPVRLKRLSLPNLTSIWPG